MAVLTDHSVAIAKARAVGEEPGHGHEWSQNVLLACDLLEMHDATGISLDEGKWDRGRAFVERYVEVSVEPNGA